MVPIRVLIIEDSEDAASLLIEQLRLGDFDPLFARVDTEQGLLHELERQPWDIVISDHAMGQFSSLDAFRMLRQRGMEIPFVVVSGTADPELPGKLLAAGVQAFIPKGQTARLIPVVQRELRVFADRTDYRRALASQRRSESRFQLFYELGSVPFQTLDDEACFVDVNPAWIRMMQHSLAEVLGRPFVDFLLPALVPQFTQQYALCRGENMVRRALYQVVSKDHQVHTVAVSGRRGPGERESYWILEPYAGETVSAIDPSNWKAEPEPESMPPTIAPRHPTMNSLLAICMFCKKIRDSDGRWEALETFFEGRDQLQFSHGFCSECARKFFPDIFS